MQGLIGLVGPLFLNYLRWEALALRDEDPPSPLTLASLAPWRFISELLPTFGPPRSPPVTKYGSFDLFLSKPLTPLRRRP
jgi:hypothetical protein